MPSGVSTADRNRFSMASNPAYPNATGFQTNKKKDPYCVDSGNNRQVRQAYGKNKGKKGGGLGQRNSAGSGTGYTKFTSSLSPNILNEYAAGGSTFNSLPTAYRSDSTPVQSPNDEVEDRDRNISLQ